jgi:muramoyltetrapeptide carboxypeptidase
MRRRDLFGLFAAAGFAPAGPTLLKAPALKPGDTVGLITPATYVSDPDRLDIVQETARYFGLAPKLGKNVRKRAGYLGGTIEERLEDLHAMFADRSVSGIFAIRGGYGSGQLLDRIDYDLIRRNPKVFIGYSDITALHLAIHKRTGLVTFHGPVMTSAFTPYTQEYYRKALFEPGPIGIVTNPPDSTPVRPRHHMRTIRPGRARGRLTGGNLSLIAMTMGTPFEIDTRDTILFIEDIGEQPYSLDRMLTNLRLAGKLQQAAGIIWGECADCAPLEYKPAFESTFSTAEVADQILGKLDVPVLSGLVIGHTDDQVTLPYGVMASLDADKHTLTIEEPATVA